MPVLPPADVAVGACYMSTELGYCFRLNICRFVSLIDLYAWNSSWVLKQDSEEKSLDKSCAKRVLCLSISLSELASEHSIFYVPFCGHVPTLHKRYMFVYYT